MLPQSPYITTLGAQPGSLVLVAAKALIEPGGSLLKSMGGIVGGPSLNAAAW